MRFVVLTKVKGGQLAFPREALRTVEDVKPYAIVYFSNGSGTCFEFVRESVEQVMRMTCDAKVTHEDEKPKRHVGEWVDAFNEIKDVAESLRAKAEPEDGPPANEAT